MRFALDQFDGVFDVRNAAGKPYVLIGGQAVNYWAETYLAQEPELAKWCPFTSEDIDFHGDQADVSRIAKKLGLPARFPHKIEMTALAGIIPFKIGGLQANIEIVRLIPGLARNKIDAWSISAKRGGQEIRVLDPISLLCGKANLALTIDQKQRRDVDHLHILLLCVRAFLHETLHGVTAGELPGRGWLGAVERVLKLAESATGKKAARKLGMIWRDALPERQIAFSKHPLVVQFLKKRLPQWCEKQKTCAR
ncbi:MAG: hypothetical protein WDM80_18860 [Limisphaerales bacterium]